MHSALWDLSFPAGQSSCFNSKTSISYTTRGWHPVPPTSSPAGSASSRTNGPGPSSNAQKGTHTMLRSSWHFVSTLIHLINYFMYLLQKKAGTALTQNLKSLPSANEDFQFKSVHVIAPPLDWDSPHSSLCPEISQLSERHSVLYLPLILLLWFSLQWCNQLNK